MFVGHAACALYLRNAFGAMVPFWLLVVGVSFCDFLFVALSLLGVETFTINGDNIGLHKLRLTHAPFSHGLTACGMMSIILIMWGLLRMEGKMRNSKIDSSLVPFALALAIPSHWFCDYIVHDQDLHLGFMHSASLGLGLWKYGYVATALEICMVIAGVTMVYKSEPGSAWVRQFGALLVLMQLLTEGFSRSSLVEDNQTVLLLATLGGYISMVMASYKLSGGI
jgi:hypothetical protein